MIVQFYKKRGGSLFIVLGLSQDWTGPQWRPERADGGAALALPSFSASTSLRFFVFFKVEIRLL